MAALNVHRVEVDFRRLMLRCEQFASAEGARAWNVTERARFAMFVKSLSERLDQMREEVERNPVAAEALPPSKLREYARRVANMGDVRQHQHQHQQQMQEQPHAAVATSVEREVMQLSRMQNSTRTASQQAAEMKTARMHQELPRRTEREQLLGSQGAAVQLSEDRQAEIRRRLRESIRSEAGTDAARMRELEEQERERIALTDEMAVLTMELRMSTAHFHTALKDDMAILDEAAVVTSDNVRASDRTNTTLDQQAASGMFYGHGMCFIVVMVVLVVVFMIVLMRIVPKPKQT